MNLHSQYPYWMIKEGIKNSFPTLDKDIKTRVAIIGGGITSALIAYKLSKNNIECTILEKRHIAHGSTSASTGLLQYEIDLPLFKLKEKVGSENAVRAYKLCSKAIDNLHKLSKKFKDESGFKEQRSLFFASYKKHIKEVILPEFEARKKAGFDVKLLDETEIKNHFGFSAPMAILSDNAGYINPYKTCNNLFETVVKAGNMIYDSTEVTRITDKKNKVLLSTNVGYKIEAEFVIIACGYESQKYLAKKVTDFNSTYAIVSKPIKNKTFLNDTLIWETKIPYRYFRRTNDDRIMIGGYDEEFLDTELRDKLIPKKKKLLEKSFNKLFPQINWQTDFVWAGVFGETKDGLPYIGSYNSKNILYALGYGGNGITFSSVAADILFDLVQGKKNINASLFSFNR